MYCGTHIIEFKKGKSVMPRNLSVGKGMEWCLMKEVGENGKQIPKLWIGEAMSDEEKSLFTINFFKNGNEIIQFGKVQMQNNKFFILPEEFLDCCNATTFAEFNVIARGCMSFIEVYAEPDFEKRQNFSLADFMDMSKLK